MIRPVAQLLLGALVLGAASDLIAGPARLPTERANPTLAHPLGGGAADVAESAPLAEPGFVEVDFAPRIAAGGSDARGATVYVVDSSPRTTLAVPLPPAVWPAGVTLGVFAISTFLRKHRR